MYTHLSGIMTDPITRQHAGCPKPGCTDDPEKVPSIFDPDVRTDLVLRIRQEIAEGTYDTPEKFEAALDKLQRRLESD